MIYLAKNKSFTIGIVIGIILIIIAPMVGGLFETIRVMKDKDRTISEESSVSMRDVAAYPLTVKRNQKYIIQFSVYTVNVSASLKILGKGQFDSEYQQNATNSPQTVTGKYFLVSQPSWAWDPSSTDDSMTSVTCNQDDYYYIEFMGDGQSSSDLIWNEPGDYICIVYGTNSFVNATSVTYNIEISKSGPSRIIKNVFSYTGWGILFLVGLVFVTRIIKNWRASE